MILVVRGGGPMYAIVSPGKWAGFDATELREAGFDADALKEAGFTAWHLWKAGFNAYLRKLEHTSAKPIYDQKSVRSGSPDLSLPPSPSGTLGI